MAWARSEQMKVVVVALALGAAPGCLRQRPSGPATAVATVNGEAITAQAFQRELMRERRESEGLGPRSETELQASRKEVLERLIERTELLQAARLAGVTASEEEVDRDYLALRADYPGTHFDELLADEEISPIDLKTRLREQIMIHKLFAQQVFSRVAVADREVEAYYAAHPQEFDHPEQVHAQQLVVKTEEEAVALRAAIKRGEPFDEVARRHSLSPDAKHGGDLGWFSRGMMPPTFDEVCFSLPEGQLSEVVPSAYGFHLFRVLARRPVGKSSLEAARPEIEARLRREKNGRAEAEFVAGLKSKATVTIDDLAIARVR